MRLRRSTVFVAVLTVLVSVLASCPMPFQYSGGDVATQSAESDPSSPSITASPKIAYLADAGDNGTAEHESAVTTSSDTRLTLSSETDNAIIYYTTDGSTPDPRDETTARFDSASPITLRLANPTVTESAISREIRAIAIGPNMKPSLQAMATVTVQYPQAVTPIFDPAGGAYQTDQSVTLSTATDGATIYYSVEASSNEPSRPVPGQVGTEEYVGPIALTGPENTYSIAAIAVVDQQLDSTTARAQYTVDYVGLSNPTFNPPGGTYSSVQTVTISSSAGATIWYTTDGSDPIIGSSNTVPAGGTVTVDRTTTLKAIAAADQNDPSDVVTQEYVLRPDPPTFSLAGGSYGAEQNITVQGQTGDTIWYTTDGSVPVLGVSSSFTTSGVITVDRSMTIRALAHRSGWEPSVTASQTYTLVAPAPTLNVAGGSYSTEQAVTLQAETGDVIWYTTNGTAPAVGSSPSFTTSGVVTVDQSMTIRAIVSRTGWQASSEASATYTLVTPAPTLSPSGGSFASVFGSHQEVTIQAAPGAGIWYTNDGSAASASGIADFTTSGAVPIEKTMTIRAVAQNPGWEPSSEASGAYELEHLLFHQDQGGSILFTFEVLSDTTDDRGSGDFFSMDVDVDQNGAVTANVDVAFGIVGGTGTDLCTQYFLGVGTYTGCSGFASAATLTSSFATSSALATPHIIWELTVPKAELSSNTQAHIVVDLYEAGSGSSTYPAFGTINGGPTITITW